MAIRDVISRVRGVVKREPKKTEAQVFVSPPPPEQGRTAQAQVPPTKQTTPRQVAPATGAQPVGGMTAITGESVLVTPRGEVVGTAARPRLRVGTPKPTPKTPGLELAEAREAAGEPLTAANVAALRQRDLRQLRQAAGTLGRDLTPAEEMTTLQQFQRQQEAIRRTGGIGAVGTGITEGTFLYPQVGGIGAVLGRPTQTLITGDVGITPIREPSRDILRDFVQVKRPPRQETIPDVERMEFVKPGDFKLTPGILFDVFGTGVERGVTRGAELLGVPTITKEAIIKERRFPEAGTGVYDPLTGQYVIPKREPLPAKFQPRAQVEFFSPTLIGKTAKTVTQLGVLASPLGVPILTEEVIKGVKTARQEVPTVKQVIEEQTQTLTPVEKRHFLESEEGKQYKKEVEGYVQQLERQKRLAIGGTVLTTAGLLAPVAIRGTRFLTKPKITPLPRPKHQPLTRQVVVLPIEGKRAVGFAVGGIYTPPWLATKQSPLQKLFRRKPEVIEYAPARRDVFGSEFLLEGEKATAREIQKRIGRDITLEKYFQTAGIAKPTLVTDLSKLPRVPRFVGKALPPRIDPEGALTTYLGVSRRFPGRPTTIPGIRERKASKFTREFFLPTKPLTTEFGISIARLKKIPTEKALPFEVFAAEQATKATKSLRPRAIGKVDVEPSIVFVGKEPIKPVDVDIITGRGVKKLTKKQQEQLAARALQLLPPTPKPKLPSPKTTIVKPEPFVFAPTMVGGLGRGLSQYLGRGTYELTPGGITAVTPTTQVISTKPAERIRFVTFPAVREVTRVVQRERGLARELQFITPRVTPIERVTQPQRIRERVRLAQRISPRLEQKPIFKPRILTPRPPVIRAPTVKPPNVPVPIITPELEKPKPKPISARKREDLFVPFIRRRGVFFPISRPLPKKKAVVKGVAKLRQTLAASLQLRKPSGEVIPFAKETPEFRIGREGAVTLIQRAPRRLGTIGEVAEILRARKGGINFL